MMRHILFALFLLALQAGAHPLLQDAMWLVFSQGRVRVAVNVSLKEITVAQAVQSAADGGYDAEELAAAAERHREYLVKHLEVCAGGRALAGTVVKVSPPPMFTSAEKTFYQYEMEYPLDGARPREVSLRHEMLREFPYALGTPWDVSYVVRMKPDDSPDISTGLLRAGSAAEFATGWDEPAPTPPARGKLPLRSVALVAVSLCGAYLFLAFRRKQPATTK